MAYRDWSFGGQYPSVEQERSAAIGEMLERVSVSQIVSGLSFLRHQQRALQARNAAVEAISRIQAAATYR